MRPLALALVLLQDQATIDWQALREKTHQLAAPEFSERAAARAAIRKLSPDRAELIRSLNTKERRETAALALGVLGEAKALEVLKRSSRNRDLAPALRAAAFEAMRSLPVDEDVILDGLLKDGPEVALAAARALADDKSEPAVWSATWSKLWGAYRIKPDPKIQVALLAMAAVMDAKSPGVLASQCRQMEKGAPGVCEAIVLALYQAESVGRFEFCAATVRTLRRRDDLKPVTREMAGLILLREKAVAPEDLTGLLNDPSPTLRHAAIDHLRAWKSGPLDLEQLLLLLKATDLPEEAFEVVIHRLEGESGLRPSGDRARDVAAWEAWIRRTAAARLDAAILNAIDRGVAALQQNVPDGETAPGQRALAVYTLLKCGVKPGHFALKKPLEKLAATPPAAVYDAGLRAMAFGEAIALSPPSGQKASPEAAFRKGLNAAADYLIRAQGRSGAWSYSNHSATGVGGNFTWDNSNTQFAILGLRAAKNAGARVPDATWAKAEKHLLEMMQAEPAPAENGVATGDPAAGWGYCAGGSPTWNMTCGGLSGLMISKASPEDKASAELAKSPKFASAFRWIARHYRESMPGGEGAGRTLNYYGLWSLERACMLAGVEQVGERNWYHDGARALVEFQGENGHWNGQYQAPVDTCLALLFLKRAYVPVATPGTESLRDEEKK